MSRIVALVLETSALLLVEKLSRQIPVWIADTPLHAPLKRKQSEATEPLLMTWIPLRANESLQECAFRIAASLDQHYDEYAQESGYDTLWVVGLLYEASHLDWLVPLGFKKAEPAWEGFIAIKGPVGPV